MKYRIKQNKQNSKSNKILILFGIILTLFISFKYLELSQFTQNVLSLIFYCSITYLTYLIIIKIDRINLERDLYCVGLKVLGIITMFSTLIPMIFMLNIELSHRHPLLGAPDFTIYSFFTLSGVFIITAFYLIVIGGFMFYRSTRRYGLFVYNR